MQRSERSYVPRQGQGGAVLKRQNFSLPEETRAQLEALAALHGGNASEATRAAISLSWGLRQMPQMRALMLDLDMDLDEVVIRAVSDLWQREIGEAPRDLAAEIDELRARLDSLRAAHAAAEE